jgi:hypothetical protein
MAGGPTCAGDVSAKRADGSRRFTAIPQAVRGSSQKPGARRLLWAMVDMWGRTIFGRQWITAAALVLAVVSGLVLPCLCAPGAPQHGDAARHACCASKGGLRAAEPSCCPEGHETVTPTWTAAPLPSLASPVTVAAFDVAALPAAAGAPSLPPARPVSASPPLRI